MTHRDVPICRHDSQEDTASKLVDAGRSHVDLAHDLPERPQLEVHRGDQEGDADQEALIGDRKVDDVHVGDCLHLAEPQHHVDDQRVAEESDDADEGVEDLGDDVEGRLVGVAGEGGVVHGAVAIDRGVEHFC